MTRSVEIPEAAVEAAIDVVMDDGHNGIQCAPDRNLAVTVRAALEAARPHIEAAMCICPTDAGVTSAMRTETGQHLATCPLALYPAPAVPQPAGRYRLAWLSARRRAAYASKAFFAEARAARELEAAVPQPVDREALARLAEKWSEHSEPAPRYSYPEANAEAGGIEIGYMRAAEELAAVLAGEQEQAER